MIGTREKQPTARRICGFKWDWTEPKARTATRTAQAGHGHICDRAPLHSGDHECAHGTHK